MANDNRKWTTLLAGSLLVLAGWAAYSNSFHGPLIFDDFKSILENFTIRHLWPIGPVLSPPSHGETVSGRPILNLSFALNYAWGGTNVWGYHVVNLVIHLLGGLLLLGILQRTFLLPALRRRFGHNAQILAAAIALLWIVHPLHVESVTYIAQRAESLASLFYLLVLYAVIRGSSSGRSVIWSIVAVAACWLGVATKEIVATAPVMVLLYDRTLVAGTFRQALHRRWGLYLGLAASWALLIGLMLQRGFVTMVTAEPGAPGIWDYARSQPGVILFYLRLVLYPYPLCLGWGWSIAEGWNAYGPMLVIGLLLAATIWGLYRGNGWGLLGAWFFLILAPSSSFVPLLQLASEHRMYLPLASVIALLVIGAYLIGQKWIVHGRLAIGLCLVILAAAALGLITFKRNQDYRSEVSIWTDTVTKDPYNAIAYSNLGTALLTTDHVLEAIEYFKQAIEIDPTRAQTHNNWGAALVKLGRPSEALDHFQRAVQIKPAYAKAHNYWGGALVELGRPLEAIEHFQQAVKIDPNDAEAYYNWGNALSKAGQFSESLQYFEKAAQLDPEDAKAQTNWGNTWLKLDRPAEAIGHFQQAVQIDPKDAAVYYNLGNAYLAAGQPSDAIPHYKQAFQIAPDYTEAHTNWGIALSMLGRQAEAIEHFQEAVRIQPNDVDTQANLMKALMQAGRTHEAEKIRMRLQLDRNQKPVRSGP